MVARLRRYFDIRPGEGLPVLLSFSYIGVVIASYVLARAIRSGLFIEAYGPFALVYVAAASPVVLVALRAGLHDPRRPARLAAGHHRNAALFQLERPGLLVRLQSRADSAPDGRVLRLGELLRSHRARARVELRELALRYTSGETTVRPDRFRRIPRRNRRRLSGPDAGRTARGLHELTAGTGAPHPVGNYRRDGRERAHPTADQHARQRLERAADVRPRGPSPRVPTSD